MKILIHNLEGALSGFSYKDLLAGVLEKELGLTIDLFVNRRDFDVIDEQKFLLAVIKYGIIFSVVE